MRPVPAAPPAPPARRTARGRGGRPVAPPNVATSLARESFAQNCARISCAGCSHRRVPQPIGGKLGAKDAPRTSPTTLEAAPPSSPRSGGATPTHGPVVGPAARPPRAPGGLYKASRPLRWSRGQPEVPAAPGRHRVLNFIRRPGRAGDLRPVVRPEDLRTDFAQQHCAPSNTCAAGYLAGRHSSENGPAQTWRRINRCAPFPRPRPPMPSFCALWQTWKFPFRQFSAGEKNGRTRAF